VKLIFQRVRSASVTVDGAVTGAIGQGALLLLGVGQNDTEREAALLAKKAAALRVFTDESGKFNLSLLDIGGGALTVPNFTLYGNCSHGRRPEFIAAARPEQAEPLYKRFTELLRENGVKQVETGVFGAHMRVFMEGDGPVTLIMDTDGMK